MPLSFPETPLPVPPAELIGRVTGHFNDDDGNAFDKSGRETLEQLERGLRVTGREVSDFERVLDFGCGPARLIRHLGAVAQQVEVHGLDIDADAIEWARRHITFAHFAVGPDEPPTEYPEGFFDLVLNHSVFTHLDARYQDLWLAELERVTRPHGLLLLTVHGTRAWTVARQQHESAGEDAERLLRVLERDGILFEEQDAYVGSSHPPFYHSTFHAPWYVFEHWTRFFDLVAYIPVGSLNQDLVVLRRRAIGEAADEPIRRRPSLDLAEVSPGQETTSVHPPRRQAAASQARLQPLLRRFTRRLRGDKLERRGTIDGVLEHHDRELRMLKQGLYEQGQRISALARELRTSKRSE